jgi:hypothetical protein
MPATVIVNSLTVVHKDSGGMSMIFPDVCKTPSPAGPIPMPYPNVAKSQDTDAGSSSVKMDGNPIMLKSSSFMLSTGDEAGSAMGVVSNKIKGKAYPKLYSFDVKVDGDNVFRLTDIMLQNGGSPTNTPPGTEVQSPGAANPAGPGTDPEVPQVTKLAWAKQEGCCGDEIELDAETKNFPGGAKLPINVVRKAPGDAHGTTQEGADHFEIPISGDKGNVKWIARRGRFEKEVKLTAEQLFYKGTRDSNQLTLKTAPDAKQLVGPFQRTTPQYVQQTVAGVVTWVPNIKNGSPVNYGWQVCYEPEVKNGIFTITRKIDFQLIGGSSASDKKKKRWKREIEQVWNKQFKIHRTNCKRGDTCDCYAEQGCCSFAIHIACEWGGGQGKQVELHAGANQASGWGTPLWWYSHTWWEEASGVPATVRAHEFGHQIGMYDEYPAGACDPLRLFTNVSSSVMSSGRFVFERHFKEFHDWFKSQAGSVLGDTKLLRM